MMNLTPGQSVVDWALPRMENALRAAVCTECECHEGANICLSKRKNDDGSYRICILVTGGATCESFKRKVRTLAMMFKPEKILLEFNFQ